MNRFVRHLRRAALAHESGGRTDGQLLECFVARRDETAFEALVRRHGPMVLGVCRRLLGHAHDAEDAFQATFLVLVRKAATLRQRELVGNWLYGTAYRAALETKAASASHRAKERQVREMPEPEALVETDGWCDLRPLLDRELNRLPDKYRVPVVLCDLEGRKRKEVARQLHIPEGTLSSRLAKARKLLAKRLARHHPALSGGALALALSPSAASACVPSALVVTTVQAATLMAAGSAAGGAISAKVAAVTEGVLRAMFVTKLKVLGAALLACCLLGSGGAALLPDAVAQVAAAQAAPPGPIAPAPAPPQAGPEQPARVAASDLEGHWANLASTDEVNVARAIAIMTATPKESVPFLKKHLQPVKTDPRRTTRLIADLDHDKFAVRVKASGELEYLGKYAKADLEKALSGNPSLEARRRIEQLLQKLHATAVSEKGPVLPAMGGGAGGRPGAKVPAAGGGGAPGAPAGAGGPPAGAFPGRPVAAPGGAGAGGPGGAAGAPGGAAPKGVGVGGGPGGAAPKGVAVPNQGVAAGQPGGRPGMGAPRNWGPTAGQAAPSAPLGNPRPSALWLRAARAIVVLEAIATPEARHVLQALSDGEPDALPTKEAKAALERLSQRPHPAP
jgi:RNA polymerase sigma factor (sigma-70 family)